MMSYRLGTSMRVLREKKKKKERSLLPTLNLSITPY